MVRVPKSCEEARSIAERSAGFKPRYSSGASPFPASPLIPDSSKIAISGGSQAAGGAMA